MCGILGYVSVEKSLAMSEAVAMLRALEYRGYDSWGISYSHGYACDIIKGVGKIPPTDLNVQCDLLLGHTRWATHGKVTVENAHPHQSRHSAITMIHNGIIENYHELKAELKGYTFKGETDSEILCNYLEKQLDEASILSSLAEILKLLKGTYSLSFTYKEGKRIYFARKDSPLLLGLGDGENFLSSDVLSFHHKTKRVIYLENGDYGYIEGATYKICHSGSEVYRGVSLIDWDIKKASKGEFEHFMLKEITEQADVIAHTLDQNRHEMLAIAAEIRQKNIFLVACGTSYNAALASSYEFLSQKKFAHVIHAHEFSNYLHFIDEHSLVIAISQSGETIDVIDALKSLADRCATLAIVNVKGSTLDRMSDYTIYMNVGPEIAVLSTKSYSASISILMLLAALMQTPYEEAIAASKDIIRNLYYLTSYSARKYIKELATTLTYSNHLFTIGRDRDYATAMEVALKIKEVSYIHAEGFSGGEIKHGPIALIEHNTPCIVFVPNRAPEAIISNAQELKARGAFIIGVGERKYDLFDYWIKVRGSDRYSSILKAVPCQILAYYLAILKGYDPDKPRNLAKSVTVK